MNKKRSTSTDSVIDNKRRSTLYNASKKESELDKLAKLLKCSVDHLRSANRDARLLLLDQPDGPTFSRLVAILGHSVSPDQPRSDLSIILADHIESLVNPTPTSTSTIPSSGTEMPPWLGVLLQRQDKADNLAQEQQRLLTEHSRLQTIMMEKLTSFSASKPTYSPPPACTVVPPTLPPRVAPALPVAPAAQNVADELQKVIQPYQEFLMEQVKSGGSVFRWATAQLFQTHREGSAHDLLRSGVRALSIIEALMGTQPHTFQLASSKFLMEATHTEADTLKAATIREALDKEPRSRFNDNNRSDQRQQRGNNTSNNQHGNQQGSRATAAGQGCYQCGDPNHKQLQCPNRLPAAFARPVFPAAAAPPAAKPPV